MAGTGNGETFDQVLDEERVTLTLQKDELERRLAAIAELPVPNHDRPARTERLAVPEIAAAPEGLFWRIARALWRGPA
ncbi:MAG: hypothetical protein V3S03_08460 [Vicinamibacteria bacterium]